MTDTSKTTGSQKVTGESAFRGVSFAISDADSVGTVAFVAFVAMLLLSPLLLYQVSPGSPHFLERTLVAILLAGLATCAMVKFRLVSSRKFVMVQACCFFEDNREKCLAFFLEAESSGWEVKDFLSKDDYANVRRGYQDYLCSQFYLEVEKTRGRTTSPEGKAIAMREIGKITSLPLFKHALSVPEPSPEVSGSGTHYDYGPASAGPAVKLGG